MIIFPTEFAVFFSQQSLPNLSLVRSIVVSKGTIGHPHSCRGLGCKFASKERGCREGAVAFPVEGGVETSISWKKTDAKQNILNKNLI